MYSESNVEPVEDFKGLTQIDLYLFFLSKNHCKDSFEDRQIGGRERAWRHSALDWGRETQCQSAGRGDSEEGTAGELWKR